MRNINQRIHLLLLQEAKLKSQQNKEKWFGDLLNFSVDVIYQTFEPLNLRAIDFQNIL